MAATTERDQKREARKHRDVARVPRRPGESRFSHWLRVRKRTGVLRVGKELRPAINRILGRYSKIGDPPWFDPRQFDWVTGLEDRAESIRKEAEILLRSREQLAPLHEISPDHSRIDAGDDKWKVHFLKGYGYWFDEHCEQCPETARAVRKIPGLESAFFSILEAGKHIPKHRGPTRAIFTAHLGLMIPRERDDCWIKVDRIRGHWEPGKVLMFDDTYKHEVLNDTDQDRVILLLHIRRPLRFPGSVVGKAVFAAIRSSPFIQDGLTNQRRWKAQFARDEGRG